MDVFSENQLIEQITEVGNKLLQPPKSLLELLNLLDEVEFILAKVGQAPSHLVQVALLIPMKALIADEVFRHLDPNVRITVASCLNEVTRITAPIPPFDDDTMREMFKLIVSSFENLSCQPGRRYSKSVLILQSVARLRSCVMMLDLDCDSLVTKMFELFHRIISPKHPQAVLLDMVNIMSIIVQESDSVSPDLLKVLLDNIRLENQSVSPASWELGTKVLEGCADKLRPFIMETLSSMSFCLEDYAPILSSICKPEPEPETATNVINDSSFLQVNNKPSNNLTHPAEYVQALMATDSFECVNASKSQTGRTASKRVKKQNFQDLDEEANGLQFVQGLEAVESDCVKALGTVKTASKRGQKRNSQHLDEEATDPQYVQALEASESSYQIELPDYVQALEAAESLTFSERGLKLNSKNLDEEATDIECEQVHQCTTDAEISKNNGFIRNDMALEEAREEDDVFKDKQAYHSSALGDSSKKRRGRPRKKDVIEVSEDATFKKSNDLSEALDSPVKKLLKQHEISGGYASERGMNLNSKNLDEEVTGLKCEQIHQGIADDVITKSNGIKREDMALEGATTCHSSALDGSISNGKRRRGRPRKKDVIAASEDKSKMSQPTNDKSQSNDSVQNQRKLASSDDEVIETPYGRKNCNDDLVGCRIKVWWPLDHRFYEGTVTSYDTSVRKHKVDYTDGEEEMLNLRKERWEFIGDKTSTDTASVLTNKLSHLQFC